MSSLVSNKIAHFHGCQLSTSNSVKQHKLRKLIACLAGRDGQGMEFISLYIPREASTDEVIANLKQESDSAATKLEHAGDVKNRVQGAIKNVIQYLRLQKKFQRMELQYLLEHSLQTNQKTQF